MTTVFTVNGTDYATPEEAIAVVEAHGSGNIIKFALVKNLPGCLPDYVHLSCALWAYEDGKWYAYSIHGGATEKLREEKPCV
jgi:hypothetical protein